MYNIKSFARTTLLSTAIVSGLVVSTGANALGYSIADTTDWETGDVVYSAQHDSSSPEPRQGENALGYSIADTTDWEIGDVVYSARHDSSSPEPRQGEIAAFELRDEVNPARDESYFDYSI